MRGELLGCVQKVCSGSRAAGCLSGQGARAPSQPCHAAHAAVAGKPIVDNCLAGYNGCIFAYGQTGSGACVSSTGAVHCHPLHARLVALAIAASPPLLLPSPPVAAAGKTYTMLGSDETAGEWGGGPGRDEARGLIQRVFEHLFARMAEAGGKHLLECSFLEIYNEARGLGLG